MTCIRCDAARLGQELAQVRAELSTDQGRLASAEADAARLAFRVLELEAQLERPESVADGSSLHARLQAQALRFPAGNPRRRYFMEMADGAARLAADLEATRLAHAELATSYRVLGEHLAEKDRRLACQSKNIAGNERVLGEKGAKLYAQGRQILEATAQQDDLRRQLAHVEGHNAGLRREVQDHLATLSRIAVKLDVPAQGRWLPIERRLTDICDLVGAAPGVRGGDLLARVQRLVKRDDEAHSFSVGLHKVRAALRMRDDAPVTDVVDRIWHMADGQDAVQKLRRQVDCGKKDGDACEDCAVCWEVRAVRLEGELSGARAAKRRWKALAKRQRQRWGAALLDESAPPDPALHVLSRLVATIRWVCETRPDVAAALEINLAWIRAVELLEAHDPKEAPCSPAT